MVLSRPRLAAVALCGVLAAGVPVTLAGAQPVAPAPAADAGAAPQQAPAAGRTGAVHHGAPHHGTTHHGAAAPHSARPSHMHGTVSNHATPKRQHMMEQHARAARGGTDHESAEVDRLNSMSLQRAQGGTEAAPAGAAPVAPR